MDHAETYQILERRSCSIGLTSEADVLCKKEAVIMDRGNLPNMKSYHFNIHGDNIIECERTLSLIVDAFEGEITDIEGPLDSAVCPSFHLKLADSDSLMRFTFYPGFGRWLQDILSLVRDQGGLLRESADAILTQVTSTAEQPLLAIEYCAALQAGNQAWQRNGRAYSFALAGIPYVYITELGGYELGVGRSRKAVRVPNPAVPFSYLSLSKSLDTLALPVLVPNKGAGSSFIRNYSNLFGYADLLQIVKGLILGQSYQQGWNSLELKALEFVKALASDRRRNDSLAPSQWTDAYAVVSKGDTLVQYMSQIVAIPWSKTATIGSLTETARNLMTIASGYATGLTSSNLPMCLIPANQRSLFLDSATALYSGLPTAFTDWLSMPKDLTICWIMGFKPRGDDARPDRGLVPMARMLIGEDSDLLTVVYGPAPSATWPRLEDDPVGLMETNGLWEAIMMVSDALLIDSATATNLSTRAFVRSHWSAGIPTPRATSLVVPPYPARIGENDVDTVLHLLFQRVRSPSVFEGMCNPPGGDWSGMSLLTSDQALELRWLTLPRVTSPGAKRPDHLFQVFGIHDRPVALAIESKERVASIEGDIGPRLVKYMRELCSTSPTAQRSVSRDTWSRATASLPPQSIQFASAAAFVMHSINDLQQASRLSATDLILGLQFAAGGRTCTIYVHPCTELGQAVANFMKAISRNTANIDVRQA